MPGPPRKRQKTVHKVAELEKKINALTSALAQQQNHLTPPTDSPSTDRQDESQSDLRRTNTTNTSVTAVSDPPRDTSAGGQQSDQWPNKKAHVTFDHGQLDWGCAKGSYQAEALEPYVDIIDRNLIDMATATAIFDYYVAKMLPLFPMLAFQSGVTAQDVRTARPMLFLAILTVGSPANRPDLHNNLTVELTRQLSERILFLGEKSLELVQSVLVHTSSYHRNKYAKDLTFNQLIHSALVMCLDLGMGKRYKKLDRDAVEEAEIRRTWLGCYYFASNVSILLRHPSLVRWTPYLEECVEFFTGKNATGASDGDRWLCSMALGQRIAEEISTVFNMDDPSSSVVFAETSTQYHLKAWEKQLAFWHGHVPESIDHRLKTHMGACINLFMHEIAIHHDHNVEEFQPGPPEMIARKYGGSATTHSGTPISGSFISSAHISALGDCIDSSHRALDAWLAMPIDMARDVPNLGIVWNTYAIVALIKLHGVLHAPDNKFGAVFSPDRTISSPLNRNVTNDCSESRTLPRAPNHPAPRSQYRRPLSSRRSLCLRRPQAPELV
jgi:hypothetical protein